VEVTGLQAKKEAEARNEVKKTLAPACLKRDRRRGRW